MISFLGKVLWVGGLFVSAVSAAVPSPVFEPLVVGSSPANEADIVRLPDGSLQIYYMIMGERVESMHSADGGRTWSSPKVEFLMEGKRSHHACRTLLDSEGEAHVFFVVHDDEHRQARGGRALDVWHNKTANNRTEWGQAKRVFTGYVGAIRGAVQMPSGRIVVPFAVWNGSEAEGRSGPAETGSNFGTSIYSDDGGETFHRSPAVLVAPVFSGYNGSNYGAVEPSIELLPDGRAWSLHRTQTGRLYESFSDDGERWTSAEPTRFYSSNSPAAALLLDDGRMLVVWNNAQMPPRRADGGMLYGGRDTLHAAISADGGQTWRGFREIYLDPTRHEDPPATGDRGTAYPNVAQAAEGHVVVVTGQNERHRAIVLFHPDWLLETEHGDDLRAAPSGWSAFKEYGEPYRIFLPRELGPNLVEDERFSGGRAWHVRRPGSGAADCAVWNFPAGKRGRVTLRVMLGRGSHGAAFSLTDRFYNPNDPTADEEAMFVLAVGRDGRIGDTELIPGQWHSLDIDFDTEAERAFLRVDSQDGGFVRMANKTADGVSYLRIRSTADAADPTGILIDRVEAKLR